MAIYAFRTWPRRQPAVGSLVATYTSSGLGPAAGNPTA
ncbi:hypothetical protein JOD67_004517 [Tenggerimyces flavus]|nr:hypothetical protein [Tenggerimyces flavus]